MGFLVKSAGFRRFFPCVSGFRIRCLVFCFCCSMYLSIFLMGQLRGSLKNRPHVVLCVCLSSYRKPVEKTLFCCWFQECLGKNSGDERSKRRPETRGNTPLHLAAIFGKAQAAKALLKAGADAWEAEQSTAGAFGVGMGLGVLLKSFP